MVMLCLLTWLDSAQREVMSLQRSEEAEQWSCLRLKTGRGACSRLVTDVLTVCNVRAVGEL